MSKIPEENIQLLKKAGLTRHAPGVWVRGDYEVLAERIAATDLFVTDFDQCMHPDITQGEAGMRVFRRIATSLDEPGHTPLMASMSFFAVPILAISIYQDITGDVLNSRMIMLFEKLAKNVPVKYFEEAVVPLADRFFDGAPQTLRLMNSRGITTGVVSLGLNIIIGKLLSTLAEEEGVTVDFIECTHVDVDRRGRFRRYDPKKFYNVNEDKRRMLRMNVEEFGAENVFAVGHDRDDIMLFEEARRTGGVTAGFRPMPEVLPLLDVAVFAPDWTPLFSLLQDSLSEE